MALPHTSIGTWMIAPTWLPLAMPVLLPVVPAPVAFGVTIELAPPLLLLAEAEPSSPMALPVTLIGTWIGAWTWLLVRRPELFDVVPAPVACGIRAAAPAPEPELAACALPRAPIALPETLIGASRARPAWLPEAIPLLFDVLPTPVPA